MAQFITRIELHGVYHDDPSYQILHEAMKTRGFLRTIRDINGINYHLQHAEYNIVCDLQLTDILNMAKDAALLTGKKYSVFVSWIQHAAWDYLTKA